MKKVLLLLFVLSSAVFNAKAQLGFNFPQYSLGFGIGSVKATTDVPYQKSHPAYNFNASYNITPFTSITIQYEFGQLSGGYGEYYPDALKALNASDASYAKEVAAIPTTYAGIDPYYRTYQNNFQSFTLHADVQLGEFIDYESGSLITGIAKNIYVGTGLGIVYNNIVSINRYNADSTYYYGGSDHSNNILIPARVGYQYKIYNAYDEPFIAIEVGYQKNFVFGYGLDGYSDPLFTFRNYETYGGFHFGVKFSFGDVASYRKATH